MQKFIISFLLTVLTACSDSGSMTALQSGIPDSPFYESPSLTTPAIDPLPEGDEERVDIPVVGEDDSLEFGTWNIQNFPKSKRAVAITSHVIRKTEVDLMAFEEIASEVDFQRLMDELPDFAAVLSPHEYGDEEYQKLAFIYRKADLELLDWELLFVKEKYVFPRPPLQAHFKIKTGNRAGQDIYMIAVHLKATTHNGSQQRREKANRLLETHVARLTHELPNAQVAILGDFNERVNWTPGMQVFKPWLDKPEDYTFQTRHLALAGEYTYISSPRHMIDHMISTTNLRLKPITVPKLETMIPSYRALVSDHLPVMARIR